MQSVRQFGRQALHTLLIYSILAGHKHSLLKTLDSTEIMLLRVVNRVMKNIHVITDLCQSITYVARNQYAKFDYNGCKTRIRQAVVTYLSIL